MAACRSADVHSGGQGGGDWNGLRGGPAARAPRCMTRSTRMRFPVANAPDPALRGGYRRRSNNAGGLEGGVTTGEPLVIRVGMKPISTLMSPLPTVDLTTGQAGERAERALRRHRGAGDGSHRGGAHRAGGGGCVSGKVRRRFSG